MHGGSPASSKFSKFFYFFENLPFLVEKVYLKCYTASMETLLFYMLFAVIVFAILFVGIKLFGKDAIFTIAIGTAIAANIYSPTAHPIIFCHLIFGIDAIAYTVFAFCILLMHIDHGKASMKSLLYTTLFSLFLAGFLAFAAAFFTTGITTASIQSALSYVNCIISTYLAATAMIFAFDFFRKNGVNIYMCLFLGLMLAIIINSLLYFGLTFLMFGTLGSTFAITLAGSYLGKTFAVLLCLGVFYLLNRWTKTYKKQTSEKDETKE